MTCICNDDIKKIWVESSNHSSKRVFDAYIPGKFFCYIFNLETLQYEWMGESIKDVLGCDKTDLTILQVFENIHPDDQPWHMAIENKLQALMEEYGMDWLSNYKVIYDFRFKNIKGVYIRLLKQMIQIYDEANHCYKRYGHITDITHIKRSGEPCLSLFGLNGEISMKDIPLVIKAKEPCPFTSREKEIILLMVRGFTGKEIADRLFISFDTVKNHKKNIFCKASCNSALQLMNKCRTYKWLDLSRMLSFNDEK